MKYTKTKYLLQEGLINHLNGNKGKYIAGASLAGVGAYGAANGNLGSAINTGINNASGLTGVATSNIDNMQYADGARAGLDSVKKAYTAEIDPNIEAHPQLAYDLGNSFGNGVQSVRDFLGESEEVFSDDIDDDESMASIAGKTVAVTAATIGAGVLAAKNGEKAVKATSKKLKETKETGKKHVKKAADKTAKITRDTAASLLMKAAKNVRSKKEK